MSDTQVRSAGTALVEWIDQLRGAQSLRAFALERGLDDARMSAWRAGATPRLDHLRTVAEGLGVSLAEVLIRCGLTTREEVQIVQADPAPPDIDLAIETDPRLSDDQRAALRGVVAAFRGETMPRRIEVPLPSKTRARKKTQK